MKRLLLLRHAKAEPDAAGGDHERPLAVRGRKDAAAMGREIGARGFAPALILCSTARRTAETLELVLPFLLPAPQIKLEPMLYHAHPDDLLRRVALIDELQSSAMIIGHNPGLEELALSLGGGSRRMRRIGEKFPTSAFAAFDSDAASWADAAQRDWQLKDEFRPADL